MAVNLMMPLYPMNTVTLSQKRPRAVYPDASEEHAHKRQKSSHHKAQQRDAARPQDKTESKPIKTRLLIISDTHAMDNFALQGKAAETVDVAIHCGDLTEESQLSEYLTTVKLLSNIKAPLKLVIAGNHDFSLDPVAFQSKIETRDQSVTLEDMERAYGEYGDAMKTIQEAREQGVIFLEEGTHTFTLDNGAKLTVYASPYTHSASKSWGFQYNPDAEGHVFDIQEGTDIAITHSPPKGVLDRTSNRTNAGSKELLEAVARARPKLNCFGHIHEAWGARNITWSDDKEATQFADNIVIENLAGLKKGKFDSAEVEKEKVEKLERCARDGCCRADAGADMVVPGKQTLFINAAIEDDFGEPTQYPWLVDIDLPTA